MEKAFDPWNRKEDIVDTVYQGLNYKIKDKSKENFKGKKRCIIFFSSNDLWYPNTESVFREAIIKKDRYEWENISNNSVDREIYVRDIYKSWYVTGINKNVDSVDKLLTLLKKYTAGYVVTTIGISAGGYMAIIIGCLLNAEYVISFSPQTDLTYSEINNNSFLKKYSKDHNKNKYYRVYDVVCKSKTPIYYIVGNKSKADAFYLAECKKMPHFKTIIFASKKHGAIVERSALKRMISLSLEEWDEIYISNMGKLINPVMFSMEMAGIIPTISDIFGRMKRGIVKLKRKFL